ncbi:MAG: 4-phosphopantetheinyl transferase [Bacteroidetes bacterium]|nr:4-phosphopantetheinyl transferase [Bacteroidota bacterium]
MLDLTAFSEAKGIFVKRQSETEGTELLLKKLFKDTSFELRYTDERKPFLHGTTAHISISHSHDKLVILVNEKETAGVDVELIREKVKNIQQRFLSPEELDYASNDTEILTILWAAKEAIYKTYGLKKVDFSKDMFIEKFDKKSDVFYGNLKIEKLKKRYLLKKERHGDYILVYTLNEV